jgi:hypothetical protein
MTGKKWKCRGTKLKMEQFPREIVDIIIRYVTDMQLLELSPIPGRYSGAITPLNFEIVFGETTLTDLLLGNILEAVMDASPTTDLTSLFVYSKLAEVIDFPLNVVNDFEKACTLWTKRCNLYNLPSSLPPMWNKSLPYMIFEFLRVFDVDILGDRLRQWLGESYNINLRPIIMLHTLL